MSQPWQRFLASSDAAVWDGCLAELEAAIGGGGADVDGTQLAQALCVSIYAQWLGRVSDDTAIEERARTAYLRLVGVLRSLGAGDPRAARAWGAVLAWTSYNTVARALFAGSGGTSVELAVLVAPRDHAARAAALGPFVAPGAEVFAPALYVYGSALIDLGSIHEATTLIGEAGLEASNPMVLELVGKVHERAGRWAEASEAFGRSTWPAHQFRAAINRTILGRGQALPDREASLRLVKALSLGDSEIDQAEITRAHAFVTACLWDVHDSWLVRFEMGRLDFRRRRYAEADSHLKKALALAPEPCRFPIADLRFSNLTWLTGSAMTGDLDWMPEALESAYAAQALGPDVRSAASISLWAANATGDRTLIPEDVSSWDLHVQAGAYHLAGNTPAALSCWLQSAEGSYSHRILVEIASRCSDWQLEAAVEYLLDVIVRESWDEFFPLWELGDFLEGIRSRFEESSSMFGFLSGMLGHVAGRLIDLSQFEFQHLLRAHALFSRMRLRDAAEEVLQRAGELAEGAADNLAVAIARRQNDDFDAARGHPQGLECLLRAERESRDRLERLQIARELFHYGRAQQARAILAAEGILSDTASFEPIEYIAALQCKEWLKPEEVTTLTRRGLEALFLAIQAGAIVRYGQRFVERLAAAAEASVDSYRASTGDPGASAAAAGDRATLPKGAWADWVDRMRDAQVAEDGARERALFVEGTERFFGSTSSLTERLATWGWVRDQFERALERADSAHPRRESGETPISRNETLDEDGRALEVSALWRRYLSAPTAAARDASRRQIDAFYETEKRLLADWEALRRQGADPFVRRAAFYADQAVRLLPAVVSDRERQEPHPVLRRFYECIAADCARLAGSVTERMRTVAAAFADPADASAAP